MTITNSLQNPEQGNLTLLKNNLDNINIKGRFEQMLGEKAVPFMASVMNVVRNNDKLSKCQVSTILNSAATAAVMDLPIDPNLGYAYIIPYENKNKGIFEAQFQMGAKGYVQLALRSGQYKKMTVNEVYEGEIIDYNRFTGDMKYGKATGTNIIGYLAYFQLVNGGEQYLYWTKEQVLKHAQTYSMAFKSKFGPSGPWKDHFDEMAKKTVLKTLLRKYGILSIEMQGMQKALQADQAVIHQENEYNYPDGDNANENDQSTLDVDPVIPESTLNQDLSDIASGLNDGSGASENPAASIFSAGSEVIPS